ncbi:MAG: metallophosphoesterase [Sedimentisphaerales bacterium]|nr:metallophosphoesterase [Sedimentisphaerales bacterium]
MTACRQEAGDIVSSTARWTHLRLDFPRLPTGLEGLRLVVLGDLHSFGWHRPERRLLSDLGRRSCDLMLCTGDICHPHRMHLFGKDRQPEWSGIQERFGCRWIAPEVTRAVEVLGRLVEAARPRLGAFAVQGNHDPALLYERLAGRQVRCLDNESLAVEIPGGGMLQLCGVRCGSRDSTDVPAALLGLSPERFTIGLCHLPELAEPLAAGGVELVLCGHTHGGQLCLPNGRPLMTHSRTGATYLRGLYHTQAGYIYVTRGVGSTLVPFRLFCPPEVVYVTLHRGDRLPVSGMAAD